MSRVVAVLLCALVVTLAMPGTALADAPRDQIGPTVIHSTKNDVSAPLASLTDKDQGKVKDKKEKRQRGVPQIATGAADTAVQSSVQGAAAPAASSSFDGIGQGLPGFTVQYAPPDTNGAVGPNHFVQTVNVSFAVFSKTGSLLYGPVAINTLFTGFGGLCEADNDGDPSVVYDQLADRWVITQFAVSGANGTSVPYLECLAVSTSGDPTSTYFRYSFTHGLFPDYPKLGVWPDAYYLSTNDFNANNSFAGPSTWAFDRAKMLVGMPATGQIAHLSSVYGGLLPSSLDGKTLPPVGAPNYFVSLGTSSSLFLWKFHVDFANIANSTVTGPTLIPVAGFTELCNGGTCVPQAGTAQKLDSLADRLMYRLAYRNFGDHESLVVTHSVTPSTGGGGVRWYEIRSPGGTPSVYQQSTYAPDGQYRWMASAAMDHVGDIGVGYSLSSVSINPAIAYTGRAASDPLSTLQPETVLIRGTGSQLPTLSRWGDYSSMVVDPADDCTFWYTTEYLTTNGTWNWHTRVGTFKFANCSTAPAPTVTAVAPNNGPSSGGTSITISGTGFQTGATATIGSVALTAVAVVDTSTITGTTGAHAAGLVDAVVTNPDTQSGRCVGCYTYNAAPAPTVASITPANGPSSGGTSVTVGGTNIQTGATATIGGVALSGVTVVDAATITGTTGAHAASTSNLVVVTNPDAQSGTCACTYTYDPAPAPTVTGVSPASGSTVGGTSVSISGAGFQSGATVSFGGAALTSVSVVNATTITGTTASHGVGTVDVLVTNPDAQSGSCSGCYSYVVTAPVISNVRSTANSRNATITWTTDVAADSQVEYGRTTAYGSLSALDSTLVTSHSLTLTGLSRRTTYHYRVYSRNAAGALAISGDLTFTTH
jgi:IPT/TIG domain